MAAQARHARRHANAGEASTRKRAERRSCWALGPRPWALVALLATLLLPLCALAAADDVDYLELTSLLVRDGEYERAATALAEVDPEAEG
ncbi:MAG: hypothetical protein KDI51_21600, partial [Xanthomonadales bacterium]|nr:hypothetical protein [Xanthomonadales bacterium]